VTNPFTNAYPGCHTFALSRSDDGSNLDKAKVTLRGAFLDVVLWNDETQFVSAGFAKFSVKAKSVADPSVFSVSAGVLTIGFKCHANPSLTLVPEASEYTIKVGEALNVPFTTTKLPADDACFDLSLSFEAQTSNTAASADLSVVVTSG